MKKLMILLVLTCPLRGADFDTVQLQVMNNWLAQGDGSTALPGDLNKDNTVNFPDWALAADYNLPFEVIIDNRDANNTSWTGIWKVTGASGRYGVDAVASSKAATFTWKFLTPTDGQYEVFLWWTAAATRANNLPVDIINAAEPGRVYVNQTANGGKWNSLGTYSFAGGKTYSVIITGAVEPNLSVCADAVKVVRINRNEAPPPLPPGPTENIYVCHLYSWNGLFLSEMDTMLTGLKATKTVDGWTYYNPARRTTYNIRYVTTVSGMEAALAEPNSHVITNGHSNYGLGGSFATADEFKSQRINSILTIDDDRILKCGTETVALVIDGMQLGQAYPNWRPNYKDGTSGLMPYDSSEGTPAYNYYVTYRRPGDANNYRIELADGSYVERFPDSGATPWYSKSGAKPDPNINQQYFIENPEQYYCRGEVTGSWAASGTAGIYKDDGYNGFNYLYRNAGTGANKVTFIVGINAAGRYTVSGSWFPQADHTTNAEYIINHANGVEIVHADQTNGNTSNFWNVLGTFNFDVGEAHIIATDNASSGVVIADGIMLTPVDNPTGLLKAEFKTSVRTGEAGMTVQFTDYSLAQKGVQSRFWDFGDGSTSTETNPSHTYNDAAVYSVSLTVVDSTGATDTDTKSNYIAVGVAAPLNAEFYGRSLYGTGRTSVRFYDQSIGNITGRLWDFGDGYTSPETNPTHVYYLPGSYKVKLTVTGPDGSDTHMETHYITIGKRPIYCDSAFEYKAHYYTGTSRPTPKHIVRTQGRLQPEDLNYARLFWGTCNSSYYFMDTFQRGIMFFTISDVLHYTGVNYLEGYLKGLSDDDTLKLTNLVQPVHEYYDFNQKPPSMR